MLPLPCGTYLHQNIKDTRMSSQRESVTVLEECIELQKRKSQDYQNPNSNIVQAMHYRRGVSTIHDMIAQKLLRAQSLLEPMRMVRARLLISRALRTPTRTSSITRLRGILHSR
jgi:hypothetical protein